MGAPTAGLLRAPLRCGTAMAALTPPYPLRWVPVFGRLILSMVRPYLG